MNPNTALARLRSAANRTDPCYPDAVSVNDLLEAVADLDYLLSNGGSLPEEWRQARPAGVGTS